MTQPLMLPTKYTSVNLRNTEHADIFLPRFDFTKLTALNTCPRWGLIRYDQHKRMPGESRAMALDLGSAAHFCFAALRFYQLLRYGPEYYGERFNLTTVIKSGERVLGANKFAALYNDIQDNEHEDERRRVQSLMYKAVSASQFYDDPKDRRRTVSNLETSMSAYADRQVLDHDIPYVDWKTGHVGIELPVDYVMEFEYGDREIYAFRMVGKIDGLAWETPDTLRVHENKTASRLDDAWHSQWFINHQVTLYSIYAEYFTGISVTGGYAHGLMCPLPKTYDVGGVSRHEFERNDARKHEALKWIWHTLQVYEQWKGEPLEAPEYSHSCNRYFRPCAFIPLCGQYGEEREQVFAEMTHDEWNPLEADQHAN